MNIIRLSCIDFYNCFKFKHVRIVRTPFLMHHLLWKGAACDCEYNDFAMKNFTDTFNNIGLSLRSIPPCISYCILCIQALIFKQKYITGNLMLTPSNIFFELKSSTWVSDLYGLMRSILYLISVAPICNNTVSLVQHRVITNGPVYGISYFYTVCLVSMPSSPTL